MSLMLHEMLCRQEDSVPLPPTTWTVTTMPGSRSVIVTDGGLIFSCVHTGAGVGLYKSSDYGATWVNKVPSVNFCSVSMNDAGVGIAMNGSNRRIYRSDDFGETWNIVFTFSAGSLGSTNGAVSISGTNAIACAVPGSSTLVRHAYSSDSGLTWTETTSPITSPGSMDSRAIHLMPNGVAFIGNTSVSATVAAIVRSTDFGQTYTNVPAFNAGGNLGVPCISGNPADGTVMAKVGSQYFVSKDFGVTWGAGQSTPPVSSAGTTLKSQNNRWYLTDTARSFHSSDDDGDTWTLDSTLPGTTAFAGILGGINSSGVAAYVVTGNVIAVRSGT